VTQALDYPVIDGMPVLLPGRPASRPTPHVASDLVPRRLQDRQYGCTSTPGTRRKCSTLRVRTGRS
jgi:hypothetical protein